MKYNTSSIQQSFNVLSSLGFVCENEDKVNRLFNLDHNQDKPLHQVSMKHKECMAFAHFCIEFDYSKNVSSVKLLINDISSSISSREHRFCVISNDMASLAKRAKKVVEKTLSFDLERENDLELFKKRLPIVKSELSSIFNGCEFYFQPNRNDKIIVIYKGFEMEFFMLSTHGDRALDNYSVYFSISGGTKRSLNAKQARQMIDLYNSF